MKRIIIILMVISSLAFGRKIIVKLATLAPEGTDWHGMLVEMGQEWKKATNGKVELRLYPGGVIGDERDMVRKMRIGQIERNPDIVWLEPILTGVEPANEPYA